MWKPKSYLLMTASLRPLRAIPLIDYASPSEPPWFRQGPIEKMQDPSAVMTKTLPDLN